MKKATLATLFAATAVGTTFLANAETKSENFGDLTHKAQDGKMELPSPEQVKSENKGGFVDNRMAPRGEMRSDVKNDKHDKRMQDKRDERRAERMERQGRMSPERMQGMHAQFHGMMPMNGFAHPSWGGFVAAKAPTTVADADKWQDDQFVLLEGNIVKQVGKKDYVFKDASGELTLEIDRKAWRDGMISPEDKVRVVADVEKSWGKTEVEAFSVEKADKPQPPKPEFEAPKGEQTAPKAELAPKAE